MTVGIDLDRVDELIRRVAADHILPRFRRLAAHEVREKAPGSLVTVADIEAEKALAPGLSALLPGSKIVGEEAAAEDPLVLDRLAGDDPVWIVDPVDGTMNFTKAVPRFAVLVALAERDTLRAGWIHDPVRDVTAMTAAGGGAWLVAAGGERRPLRLADPPDVAAMRGVVSGRIGPHRVRDLAARSGRLMPPGWINSAGHEYLDLLEGRVDYVVFGRTWAWDHAAGVALYREAGGEAAYVDGATSADVPYSLLRRTGPLLLAPTGATWSAIRDILTAA